MHIERIKYFIDLVECRNFTETAKKNFLSQTTISQQIASLEKEFNVQLIDRNQIPIKPTQAGWNFYHEAVTLWKQYRRLHNQMADYIEGATQSLHIECAGTIDIQMLLQQIPSFNQQYPSINVELNKVALSDIANQLKRGSYDIAITFDSEFYEEELEMITLYEGNYCAVLSSNHPLYEETVIPLKTLYQYPLVMLHPEAIGKSYELMLAHAKADGYQPNIARTADDIDTEMFYILTEKLIGFFPDNYSIEGLVGDYRSIPLEHSNHRFKIVLAYLKSNKNPALKKFIKHIQYSI